MRQVDNEKLIDSKFSIFALNLSIEVTPETIADFGPVHFYEVTLVKSEIKHWLKKNWNKLL